MAEPNQTQESFQLMEENQLDEVLGTPPNWMEKSGYFVFSLLLILGFCLSYIKYADTIPAQVKIYSEFPPVRVKSKKAGQIENIFVKHLDEVEQGAILAKIESMAKLKDVEELEIFLNKIAVLPSHLQYAELEPPTNLEIGKIRTDYANFIEALLDYQYYLGLDDVNKIMRSLRSQMNNNIQFDDSLKAQIDIIDNRIKVTEAALIREDSLIKTQLVTLKEIETTKLTYLRDQQELEELKNSRILNQNNIEALKAQSAEIGLRESKEATKSRLRCESQFQILRASIENWKEQNLVVAPVSGKISAGLIWYEGQFVDLGTSIFSILPSAEETRIVGKAQLPPNRIGKIKEGSPARIHFDNYPQTEFGVVRCSIYRMSLVPEEGLYYVDLGIDKLESTYDKNIPFQEELQGTAYIETDRRSLFSRIMDRFKDQTLNQ